MQEQIKPELLTRKKAVGGRVVRLSKQAKRIAATFTSAEQRRHHLNLMLEAAAAANGSSREKHRTPSNSKAAAAPNVSH